MVEGVKDLVGHRQASDGRESRCGIHRPRGYASQFRPWCCEASSSPGEVKGRPLGRSGETSSGVDQGGRGSLLYCPRHYRVTWSQSICIRRSTSPHPLATPWRFPLRPVGLQPWCPARQPVLARQPVPGATGPRLCRGPWSLGGVGFLLHRELRHPPVYSGKQMVKGDFLIFSPKRSFLLRKRMMEVSMKNLLLQMESKSMRDSCMRFCGRRREGESGTDSEETRRQGERRRIRFEREELGYPAAQEALPGPWLLGRRTDRTVITAPGCRCPAPRPIDAPRLGASGRQ